MIFGKNFKLITFCLMFILKKKICICTNVTVESTSNNALQNFVKLFSTPGAFNRVNEIFGENLISEISTLCPEGDKGIKCRRTEARRSVDCPTGDCYCYSCAVAGPELWASCCRESSKCCSHLAAACRNCDHLALIPFCSEHFRKCLHIEINNTSTTEQIRGA